MIISCGATLLRNFNYDWQVLTHHENMISSRDIKFEMFSLSLQTSSRKELHLQKRKSATRNSNPFCGFPFFSLSLTPFSVRYIIWNHYVSLLKWCHLRQQFFFWFFLLETTVIILDIIARLRRFGFGSWGFFALGGHNYSRFVSSAIRAVTYCCF